MRASLNVVFDIQKKLSNLPELGRVGRGNLGNARKKSIFLWEVFPYGDMTCPAKKDNEFLQVGCWLSDLDLRP